MKNILIPTDFTDESVSILSDYLNSHPDEQVNVLFFHAIKLSDSITDLLLLSRRTKEQELIPEEFKNYCKNVRKEFDMIENVRFQYFYGHTMALFRNFLEANEINLIIYNPAVKLKRISKTSIDLAEIINKSNCEKWLGETITRRLDDVEKEKVVEELPREESAATYL
ncbi:hypothetical protein H8S90_22645 [Olivibacter sp. SDN3]|uniref:hypothetical protein n=1 Tax=Olivibacter sp. SDN3 TaxID=2764720 RepID=UPI0016515A1C|nr:hypothetical protein [Olivibacter sp. SDN3]QNL49493.1 hypothetical protein H8S90_22645 [Olivibacter sp. SDN3]